MQIEYRLLKQINEFEQALDLEISIWDLAPRDAVPVNLFHALVYNGSVLIGAFADRKLVGISFAFPAQYPRALWSHMTGVHPDFQSLGIGFGLKQQQRDWALKNGYRSIHWTFDPLRCGNANFNIRRLGATANIYHVNYYGQMSDGINAGLPSDRLEVTWKLTRSQNTTRHTEVSLPSQEQFLLYSKVNLPHQSDTRPSLPEHYVEIPLHLAELKQKNLKCALEWQSAVRDSLQYAFAQGYSVTDFVVTIDRCWYVLSGPEYWFMYVVKCSDGSLYTGITNHIERRIQKHNRGKGAAYTASRRPVELLGAWRFANHARALKAEAAFKQQTRKVKLAHLEDATDYRDGHFVKNY